MKRKLIPHVVRSFNALATPSTGCQGIIVKVYLTQILNLGLCMVVAVHQGSWVILLILYGVVNGILLLGYEANPGTTRPPVASPVD